MHEQRHRANVIDLAQERRERDPVHQYLTQMKERVRALWTPELQAELIVLLAQQQCAQEIAAWQQPLFAVWKELQRRTTQPLPLPEAVRGALLQDVQSLQDILRLQEPSEAAYQLLVPMTQDQAQTSAALTFIATGDAPLHERPVPVALLPHGDVAEDAMARRAIQESIVQNIVVSCEDAAAQHKRRATATSPYCSATAVRAALTDLAAAVRPRDAMARHVAALEAYRMLTVSDAAPAVVEVAWPVSRSRHTKTVRQLWTAVKIMQDIKHHRALFGGSVSHTKPSAATATVPVTPQLRASTHDISASLRQRVDGDEVRVPNALKDTLIREHAAVLRGDWAACTAVLQQYAQACLTLRQRCAAVLLTANAAALPAARAAALTRLKEVWRNRAHTIAGNAGQEYRDAAEAVGAMRVQYEVVRSVADWMHTVFFGNDSA